MLTVEELIANAEALVPYLRSQASITEERRTLSPQIVERLHDGGFFRFFRPRVYGGYEMDWGIQYHFAKILARGCPSTAWIASVVGQHSCHVGRFSEEAQQEVWPDSSDVLIATATVPRADAKAEKVSGGVRVSGSVGFASGVDHSQWAIATYALDGVRHQVLLPRSDYEIKDTWFAPGMRGTGTKDIYCSGVLVPNYRVLSSVAFNEVDPPGANLHPSYIYSMEFAPVQGSSPLGALIGTAETAITDYVDRTKNKEGAIFGNKVADSSAVQIRVSESGAEVHAADLIARADFEILHQSGKAGDRLTDVQRAAIVRNRGFISKLCVRAAHRLVQMMGAIESTDDNPVQRHFRDIQVMSSQIGVAFDVNMPQWGRWILGLDIGPGLQGSEKKRV